jgi:hypothetical protein
MKKLLLFLSTILLLLPSIVSALETIYIKDISVEEINGDAAASYFDYNNRDINLELKFKKTGDFIKYKIVLKNDDYIDYYLSDSNLKNDSEFVTYSYEVDDNTIKHGEEKVIYLKAIYDKGISNEKLNDLGMYVENDFTNIGVNINAINVPDTYKSIDLIGIISIVTLIIVGTILIIKDRKKEGLMIFLLMLIYPISTYAINEITLNINSVISINPNEEKICLINYDNGIFHDEEYLSYDSDLKLDRYLFNEEVENISFVPKKIMNCKMLSTDEEEMSCISDAKIDREYVSCMESNDKEYCYKEYIERVLSGPILDSYYGCYYIKK